MMIDFKPLFFLITSLMFTSAMAAQPMWEPLATANRSIASSLSTVKTENQRLYKLDRVQLKQKLARSGYEGRAVAGSEIELPLKDGQFQRFSLEQSPILAPELAAKYPNIKTYKIHGLDDPIASGRLSMTSKGFHGMVTNAQGTYYIDPEGNDVYSSYDRRNSQPDTAFKCNNPEHTHASPLGAAARNTANRTAGNLQVYRLAVAGTTEYVNLVGPSQSEALSAVTVAINRVNQIFERDLAVRLQLVDNTDDVLYTTFDPYTDPADNALMLIENQSNLDAVIGPANYDIGHVFSDVPGGLALVGSACTTSKAQGVTGLSNPTGDPFYIDFVAHEIGHQFGAEHSFNGTTNGCSNGNRVAATAFEPGSGSTIMAYAGICSVEDIQTSSDAIFHAGSINQINSFTTSGDGATCGTLNAITNNPNQPTITTPSSDYTIPALTPFTLTTVADDIDIGDTLSYSWDQMDAGTETDSVSFGTDLGDNALFRSYLPQAENERVFPRLDRILSDTISPKDAEVLPNQDREINFRATVRDGKSGMATDDISISVVNGPPAFEVTSHIFAQPLAGNSWVTVTWVKANTDSAPINCGLVDIDLIHLNSNLNGYTDSTYCIEPVLSGTNNDGTEDILIPDVNSSIARFRVRCSDNIFFALSRGDLEISGTINATNAATNCKNVVPANEEHDGDAVSIDPNGTQQGDDSSGGGGAFSLAWLLSLFFLSLFIPARIRT